MSAQFEQTATKHPVYTQVLTLKTMMLALLLAGLALLGNITSYPLFFGVDFLFGSIAVLIAITLLGTRYGVVIALLAGSYTYFLWGHPYALVIFGLEALVVGLLQNTRLRGLVLADIVYWALIGAPLVWLLYRYPLGLDPTQAGFIMLKQAVNGVFNAIFATLIMMAVTRRWPKLLENRPLRFTIRELIFTMIIAGVFISTLVIVIYQTRAGLITLEKDLSERLQLHGRIVSANMLTEGLPTDPATLQRIAVLPDEDITTQISLLAPDGRMLLSNGAAPFAPPVLKTGSFRETEGHLQQWLPPRSGRPHLVWWRASVYFVQQPFDQLGVGAIVVSTSAKGITNQINTLHISALGLLSGITLIAVIVAAFISHLFTQPLTQLSAVTRNLPGKLQDNAAIIWPSCQLEEISELTQNAQHMSASLSEMLNRDKRARAELEQRVAERTAEIRAITAHSSAVINNAAEGIVTVDENEVIQTYNPAGEDIFGYTPEEVIGQPVDMLLDWESTPHTAASIFCSEQSGKTFTLRGRRKDGSVLPIELLIADIPTDDEMLYAGFFRDISERQKVERMKNEFISTVSHELRTPLTAVVGAIGLIKGTASEKLDDAHKRLLEISSNNIGRLMHIVDDLLDMQKILQDGDMTFNLEQLELMDVVEQAVDDNQSYAHSYGATISIDAAAADIQVKADRNRLLQALANLISNAAKYSPQQGTVHVSVQEQDNRVRISVEDEGEGIPAEFQAHIFEPFRQADSSATRAKGGTGLGLSITKSIIERLGGTLSFESPPNKGAHFYIDLPMYRNYK